MYEIKFNKWSRSTENMLCVEEGRDSNLHPPSFFSLSLYHLICTSARHSICMSGKFQFNGGSPHNLVMAEGEGQNKKFHLRQIEWLQFSHECLLLRITGFKIMEIMQSASWKINVSLSDFKIYEIW